MSEAEKPDLTSLAVQLLSAYVSNNQVPSSELAGLIQSTKAALSDEPVPVEAAAPEHVPAITVRKSLASRDHIVSMIDGKAYKTLKRHISTHGLTPAEYRERYNLPHDYPMVAPSYSEQRRAVAEKLGLGRRRSTPAQNEGESPREPVEEPSGAPSANDGVGEEAVSAVARPAVNAPRKTSKSKAIAVVAPKPARRRRSTGAALLAAQPVAAEAEPAAHDERVDAPSEKSSAATAPDAAPAVPGPVSKPGRKAKQRKDPAGTSSSVEATPKAARGRRAKVLKEEGEAAPKARRGRKSAATASPLAG